VLLVFIEENGLKDYVESVAFDHEKIYFVFLVESFDLHILLN
jgi:hypothetical protein